jgi:WD40 repeat protein
MTLLASASGLYVDGSRLFLHYDKILNIDTLTGKEVGMIDADSRPFVLKSNADAEWLLTMDVGQGTGITLYNLRQRIRLGRVALGESVSTWNATIARDGRSFAVALSRPDRAIDIFESATLQRRLRIRQESGASDQLAFSPTGRYLAAAQSDGTVLVYDLRGQP